jgi:hypothetical protein
MKIFEDFFMDLIYIFEDFFNLIYIHHSVNYFKHASNNILTYHLVFITCHIY